MYASILEKLDKIAVDEEGVVLLDKRQRLPESHRHFSHTMGLYPLHLINYDTDENKRIYDNTLLHLEQLGTGWWVGFSFAMSAQLYAMARNGNAAYEKLRIFAKGFVADNGFHLNGDFKNYGFSQWHYRPFTLESLFGYCDALQEMLLQDHQGYLDIFPAVPQEWMKKLSFKKLRSYGGVLVSAKALNGQIEQVELVLPCDMEIKIKNTFNTSTLCCVQDKKEKFLTNCDGYFTIQGKKGKIALKRLKV
jgi:alpha-L-fucosidase 2